VIQRNKREKAAVCAGAAAVAVFLVLQLIVFPVMDQKEVLERQQEAYREAAAEMRLLVAEYQGLQAQLVRSRSMIAQKSPGFTLFSFLDQLAGATQIKQFISYMKPSTTVQKETNYKISVNIKILSADINYNPFIDKSCLRTLIQHVRTWLISIPVKHPSVKAVRTDIIGVEF